MENNGAIVANKKIFGGILLLSMSTLMYEVLLTRVFSVTMYYHFAFMAISIALFGMSLGALFVYIFPKKFKVEKTINHLGIGAFLFGNLIIVSYLFHISIPVVFDGGIWQFITLSLTYLCFLLPFTFSGICISLALTRFPKQIGKLYACDLIGAAMGALVTILLLNFLGAPIAILVSGLISVLASLLFGFNTGKKFKKVSLAFAVGIFILISLSVVLQNFNIQPLSPVMVKGYLAPRYLYDEWNAFSRVTVNNIGLSKPFGWGFGQKYNNDTKINQLFLRIDAAAGTPITNFDGNLDKLDFLRHDIVNAVHYLRPQATELIIGGGGGRDILSALVFEQKAITSVEINGNILKALNEKFGDFSGHLDRYQNVKFVHDEARSWLVRSNNKYDIIQLSLIDSWAATTAGAFTLSENSLYTVEGWNIFLNHLKPNGILTVSRWYSKSFPGEAYRLVTLAGASLRSFGINDPRNHIILLRNLQTVSDNQNPDGVGTILVSREKFSDSDLAAIKQISANDGFDIVLSPEQTLDDNFKKLLSDQNTDQFLASLPIDVSPPTDDKPFFFQMLRIRDAFMGKGFDQGNNTFNLNALKILVYLLEIIIILTILILLVPLIFFHRQQSWRGSRRFMVFFISIGLGFMLIEISQMQRFIILLGQPTYSLAVSLTGLLAGSGLGSFVAHKFNNLNKKNLFIAAGLSLLLIIFIFGHLTPEIINHYQFSSLAVRILVALSIFLPLGFFMGTAFPIGMHLVKMKNVTSDLAPWLWALNGAASVLASVLAVIIAISQGISITYWLGFICYLVAIASLLFILMKNK